MELPEIKRVTVAVVAYNEGATLDGILSDLKKQTFPHALMEVLLVDSASEDDTKERMLSFSNGNNCSSMGFWDVRVLDNPRRIQAAGWNVALSEYRGDALIRIDAHATIASDFVEKNVAVLNSGECVCGGSRPTVLAPGNDTPWCETLHLAEESAFGSSVASYRRKPEAGYVNSLFHGAYRRCVLDEVGGFNEGLLRTEDNDFHYRIREAGYRIRLDPSIRSAQYVRSSLTRMLKQKYGNGYWVGRTVFVQPKCLEIYHFAPFAFVLGMSTFSFLGFLMTWLPLMTAGLSYVLACVLLSLKVVVAAPDKCLCMIFLPVVFVGIHVSYGVGTVLGIARGLFEKRSVFCVGNEGDGTNGRAAAGDAVKKLRDVSIF